MRCKECWRRARMAPGVWSEPLKNGLASAPLSPEGHGTGAPAGAKQTVGRCGGAESGFSSDPLSLRRHLDSQVEDEPRRRRRLGMCVHWKVIGL